MSPHQPGRCPRLPGPRAHLSGTLATFDRVCRLAGPHPDGRRVRELLAREAPLGSAATPEDNGLKWDLYVTSGAGGRLGWGATVNDRWEGPALEPEVAALADAWGIDLAPWRALRAAVGRTGSALTAGVGFDGPDGPPRLKLYVHEEPWGAGVGDCFGLVDAMHACSPGWRLPDWLDSSRPAGVVALTLRRGAAPGLKLYLGGSTASDACLGAPGEVRDLGLRLGALCTLPGCWHYVTVRLEPDRAPRYAIDRIYEHVRIGFDGEPGLLDRAWAEVGGLLASAGAPGLEAVLRGDPAGPVVVVPTATALEDGGRSADVYCASWGRSGPAGA